MFEVQSWANHSSQYEIIQTDQLPDVVYENIRLMIEENDPDIQIEMEDHDLNLYEQFELTNQNQ